MVPPRAPSFLAAHGRSLSRSGESAVSPERAGGRRFGGGDRPSRPPDAGRGRAAGGDRRLRGAVFVLSAVGAGIAAYLTYAHLAHVTVACATNGCETVQTSRYAELAGVPVAALGLAGYLVLAATAASGTELARAIGLAAAAGGLGFAGYLLYVQAALIGAFCQWCLASDLILLLLVAATALRFRTD